MNCRAVNLVGVVVAMVLFSYGVSLAHFGMVIPSDNMVMQDDKRKIELGAVIWVRFEAWQAK